MSPSSMTGFPDSWTQALRSAELFGELDPAALARLAPAFRPRQVTFGENLLRQGEEANSVFVVVQGRLQIILEGHDDAPLSSLGPGSVVGEMALVIGGTRSATVRALEPSTVLELARDRFDDLLREHPELHGAFSRTLLSRTRLSRIAQPLRDLFGHLDADALANIERQVEWVHLPSGKELFHQGDPAGGAYIVTAGRLRVVVSNEHGDKTIDEVGPGQWIGEMALLTQRERSATVYAVRDAELVLLSQTVFDRLIHRYPAAMLETARRLAERLAKQIATERRHHVHTNTIAIVPMAPRVQVERFTTDLVAALGRYGTVLHLTSDRVDERLGKKGIASASNDDPAHLRLIPWLIEQESAHRFVVYQADQHWSGWSDRAIRNADRVLVVADASASPSPVDAERQLVSRLLDAHGPKRTLVLMQPAGADVFPGTARWLDAWHVDSHFHVRRGASADIDRVARVLTGNAVCLVLGGGASRAFAHIGVLRAFEELSIPIDAVGGTSMGGAIAFAIARGQNSSLALKAGKEITAQYFEPTLPLVSLMSAKRVMKGIVDVAGTLDIEDLLTTFFCISTNLTRGSQVVHRRGSLAKAVRATTAIPGLLPPVQDHGDLLVDGGLSDNVPVAPMVALLGGVVIAVDVIPEVDLRAEGDVPTYLSGWNLALRRLNPLAARVDSPNIASILLRSVTIASDGLRSADRSAKLTALYLRPRLDNWNPLDFKAAASIADQGYRGTVQPIRTWWAQHSDHIMGRVTPHPLPRDRRGPVTSMVPSAMEDAPPSSLW